MEGCNCKVTISQETPESQKLHLKFDGDVKHIMSKPKKRQIHGRARREEIERVKTNPKVSAAGIYRKKLRSIEKDVISRFSLYYKVR